MTGLLLTLRPTANVTPSYTYHRLSGGGYASVDEDPANDADFVYATNATDPVDMYEIENPPAYLVDGAPPINSVRLYARFGKNNDAITGGANMRVRTYSTYYDDSGRRPSSTWTQYNYSWSVNPYTESAWTWTEITNLQIGVLLTWQAAIEDPYVPLTYTKCSQIYAVVDWSPYPARRISGLRRI